MIVYTDIYISFTFEKYIYIKIYRWRNQVIICYSKRVRKTPEAEGNFKKSICIFTENLALGQFPVSACTNQGTGFSVNGSSTSNGLFQTITGLKRLMGYSKRLHQL